MSATSAQGIGYAGVAPKWGWFVVLGAVLIACGVFALGDVVAVTLASTIFIGAMMAVGGVVQIIHAFMTKGWRAFALNLFLGLLYLAGGVLIFQEPVQGSILITMLLLAAFVVGGVIRVIIAFRHRELAMWWLMALSGLVSVVVGILLYSSMPWSGLWVLGTLIGIELIVSGVTWLQFGFALRVFSRRLG